MVPVGMGPSEFKLEDQEWQFHGNMELSVSTSMSEPSSQNSVLESSKENTFRFKHTRQKRKS
jgi:hypothetical protein